MNTIYQEPRQSFVFFNGLEVLVDLENPKFQKILQWHRAIKFDVLCAQNPNETIHDGSENEQFHEDLKVQVKLNGWRYLEGIRKSTIGDWPDEQILV